MTFLSYSIVVTILGVAYFSFVITADLFGKKKSKKAEVEEFDNSDMETPTMIGDEDDEEDNNEEEGDDDTPSDLAPEEAKVSDGAEQQEPQNELFDRLIDTQENTCETVHPQYQEMLPSEAFRVMMCQPDYLVEKSHLVIRQVLT